MGGGLVGASHTSLFFSWAISQGIDCCGKNPCVYGPQSVRRRRRRSLSLHDAPDRRREGQRRFAWASHGILREPWYTYLLFPIRTHFVALVSFFPSRRRRALGCATNV